MKLLDDKTVCEQLRAAWDDSRPGTGDACEQGGFILQGSDGSLFVERWPRGSQDQIRVPHHPGGRRNNRLILATFHTHPNPELEYQQEQSLNDVRAVRADPDLRHPEFEGEYVIATEFLYRIRPDGTVEVVGDTKNASVIFNGLHQESRACQFPPWKRFRPTIWHGKSHER